MAFGWVGVQIHSFLNSVLSAGDWSPKHSARVRPANECWWAVEPVRSTWRRHKFLAHDAYPTVIPWPSTPYYTIWANPVVMLITISQTPPPPLSRPLLPSNNFLATFVFMDPPLSKQIKSACIWALVDFEEAVVYIHLVWCKNIDWYVYYMYI